MLTSYVVASVNVNENAPKIAMTRLRYGMCTFTCEEVKCDQQEQVNCVR